MAIDQSVYAGDYGEKCGWVSRVTHRQPRETINPFVCSQATIDVLNNLKESITTTGEKVLIIFSAVYFSHSNFKSFGRLFSRIRTIKRQYDSIEVSNIEKTNSNDASEFLKFISFKN